MIDVLVIDKTEQITFAIAAINVGAQTFNNEVRALNAVESKTSVVILLNYNVMQEQTAEYISVLQEANPTSKIVVIADELSEEDILKCLLAGAKGYQALSQLNRYAEKLVTVMDAGEAWITRRMTATLIDSLRQQQEEKHDK